MIDTEKMQEILNSLRHSLDAATSNVADEAADPAVKESTASIMVGVKALLDAYAEGVTKMTTLVIQTENDERQLRRAVEEVALGLEGSLTSFKSKMHPRLINKSSGKLPENVGQIISAVIEYTEQSTLKTINFMNELDEIRNTRVELIGKIKWHSGAPEGAWKPAEIAAAVKELDELEEKYQTLHCRMLENQAFQDLTGQALQLLVWLVNSVEEKLRKLAAESGIKVPSTENKGGAGGNETKRLGETDIDALLAALD